MKIRSCASVIILGIGVLPLTTSLASASPGGGQGVTPGNAMNPPAVSPVVERDPEGLGIGEHSRSPTGLLTASPTLVKEPSQTSGGLLYRMTVEFGGLGVGGDKDAAKFREYKDLDSGAYLNNFSADAREAEKRLSPRRGGRWRGPDRPVLRRGCRPIQHVESARLVQRNAACLHVELPVAVGRSRQRRAHVEGPSPGRHHRREYDPGEHAPGDLVHAGLRSRAHPEEEPDPLRLHAFCELESLCQLYPGAS